MTMRNPILAAPAKLTTKNKAGIRRTKAPAKMTATKTRRAG